MAGRKRKRRRILSRNTRSTLKTYFVWATVVFIFCYVIVKIAVRMGS